MQPSALFLVIVALGTTMVQGHPTTSSPAEQHWQKTLPGTPMPEAIANLVQRGIDHSPLLEHYSALPSVSVCTLFNTICPQSTVAEAGIFFHEEQLRPGSIMTISLLAEPEAAILPHDVAEKVPFENIGDVLATFNIPAGSPEADQVSQTLSRCKQTSLAGVQMSCSMSLESTVESAMRMLGTTADSVFVATSAIPAAGLPRQPYLVQKVRQIDGNGYVACHKLPFPYVVYQCHTEAKYGDYMLSLQGLHGGPTVTMQALCHLDTSNWNPAHPAFEILHTHPGGSPVCHLIPNGNLVFIVKAAKA
ncbi:hypothetical protein ACP4OV_029092 [Aristida adscensionis]